MNKGKVLICWLDDGMVEGGFAESLLRVMLVGMADHQVAGWIRYETGPAMAWARNNVVEKFLQDGKAEWLLFLDSDMVYPHDMIRKLLEVADPVKKPVVGGLYFGALNRGTFPVAYRLRGSTMVPIKPTAKEKLLKVDGAGTGCMLIHRDIFASTDTGLLEPGRWFDHIWWGGKSIGEDLSFCYRLHTLNIPVWLRQDLDITHLKWRRHLTRAAWDEAQEKKQ